MTQSLNYRDPYLLINSFIILIMLSKTTFNIYQKRVNFKWNHFQNGKKRFSTKLRHLKSNMKQHQTKQVSCDDKVKAHLVPWYRIFFIVTIENSRTKTYSKVDTSKEGMINTKFKYWSNFGMVVTDKQKDLPIMYWLTKMHKTPLCCRFIVASKQYTLNRTKIVLILSKWCTIM